MPWCPVCGAEYREGMETCPKCRVALQASPPPPREDPIRPAVPRLLRGARSAIAESLYHAAGGWRVLRRHRALLVVPLLVALYESCEMTAYRAVSSRPPANTSRSVSSHELERRDAGERLSVYLRSMLLHPSASLATATFAVPFPWLSFQPTVMAIEASKEPATSTACHPESAGGRLKLLLPLGLYLLGPVVSGFLLAGFFSQARSAMTRDTFTWSDFGRDGRRYWLRLFLLLALFSLLYAYDLSDLRRLLPSLKLWNAGAAYVVRFFLALTWCAIVVDDAGFGQALGRSIVTVARAVGVGVCLLLLLSLVRKFLSLAVGLAATLLYTRRDVSLGNLSLYLSLTLIQGLVFVLVATWFSLTALHWYRAARAKIEGSP